MANKEEVYPQQVNLENCSKEPIHIIGKTQAHGLLLICEPSSLIIRQSGTNAFDFFSISHEELIGRSLASLLEPGDLEKLKESLKADKNPLPVNIIVKGVDLVVLSHFSGKHLIVDIESLEEAQGRFIFENHFTKILRKLEDKKTIEELCNSAAEVTKEIFGYDRVMVYKFDQEWNGEVLSEVKENELESWLGLRYPATDIPEQSRALFLKQRVRVIVDVDYLPVPIEPEVSPLDGQPVDISRSSLRAVSPIHIEYLKNMEVGASLSAAIIVEGKLWGLIACHHKTSKFLDYYSREIVLFLAQIVSSGITLIEANHYVERTKSAEETRKQLVNKMHLNENIPTALTSGKVKVTDLIRSGGAAIFFKDRLFLCGKTPAAEQVESLLKAYLRPQGKGLFYTENLSEEFPEAAAYKEVASGIMSLRIAENKYIIWFRPQVLQTVNWGGDPNNKAFYNEEKKRISPRKSFKKWSEKLTGRSESWESYELAVAKSLRENVSHIILAKQRKEINALNESLLEANRELELFSYGLSHDLRAPIRGLEGYLEILQEDFAKGLSEEGRSMLKKTRELAEKMDQLVGDILEYSRLSHSKELKFSEISVKDLIEEILDFFNSNINYPQTKITIADNLPNIYGDRRMLFQLWSNLLNNALKYSEVKDSPQITVGVQKKDKQHVFFVSDNGIGIKNEFLDKIFNTFSRVVGNKYNGSGIGLAIAKKIVEKHDGHIWAESSPGEGSTFYFNLGNAKRIEIENNDQNTFEDFTG